MRKIPLILTRPEGANSAFAADFPKNLAVQLEFVECPLLRIVPVDAKVRMEPSAAAIFTSVNGVRFAPALLGRTSYCVGMRTTQAARAAGWEAVCVGRNAEELITELQRARPEMPLYHLSGVHVRGDIVERLIAFGLEAQRIEVYDQHLLPLTDGARAVLAGQDPVIVPLYSPRAASHFTALTPPAPSLRIAALSGAVADAITESERYDVLIAREPTADAMIALIEKQVGSICLG